MRDSSIEEAHWYIRAVIASGPVNPAGSREVRMSTTVQDRPKRPSVVLLLPLAKDLFDRVQECCDVTVVEDITDRAAVEGALEDADGVLLSNRLSFPVDESLLRGAERLRVISNFGIGLDHVDLEYAEQRKIAVFATPVLMDAVADLVMTFLLMLTRRMPEAVRAVRPERWRQVPLGHDPEGKTLFIIGFGRIGQEVARRALAFRMKVLFYDVRDDLPMDELAERVTDIHTGLKVADFVTLHVDLNPDTHHLIGAEELAMMKSSAYLINTARGGVVDQSALEEALSEERIAGAGIDVLECEPPRGDEPILDEPRAIIAPHIGSATEETRRAMMERAVENLIAATTSATAVL